jgi:hypothetical protein
MKYSFQELNDFEQITFKNMVTFYREELERIANGEMSTEVLSKGDRRVLRRLGVLELHFTGHNGRLLQVSARTQEILKIMKTRIV